MRPSPRLTATAALLTATACLVGATPVHALSPPSQSTVTTQIVRCGGGGEAPLFGWADHRSATSVGGYNGVRISYVGGVSGGNRSAAAIQLRGFENGREVWVGIGARNSTWAGSVPWGNSLAHPAIRVQTVGVFPVRVSFDCRVEHPPAR